MNDTAIARKLPRAGVMLGEGGLGVYGRPNRPKAGKHEVSHFCNRPKTPFIRPK
jgi:hypothetical protein